jgi:DNA replication protein DnaC
LIFDCDICNESEWVYNAETNGAAPCKCREGKYYKRILEASGISESFQLKTVNGYKPKNTDQIKARKIATDFIQNYETIKTERCNSLAFLGQPGSGKTHLITAIANALLKKGIGVLYMQYREDLTHLKQVITDNEEYQKQINKFKQAPVLLIDDLFKGATRQGQANESEMGIMFEIINHRYLKNTPIMVSSECNISKMIEFDEAVGSRIAHMCKEMTVELKGIELNDRMI